MTSKVHTPADVVDAVREICRRGLTASSLGNVSIRSGDRIWITPTRVYPDELDPGDLVLLDGTGRVPSTGKPYLETPMHVAIYASDRTVDAIVHTHSPWATAWGHRARDLDLPTEELSYHGLRRIPCTGRALARSARLALAAVRAVAEARVGLLAGHGVVATGRSLRTAIERAALAEQQAHIQWLTPAGRGAG
jgi:L-ribulose-5-phosphate 4-epimerase